jgi:hypothetical protein
VPSPVVFVHVTESSIDTSLGGDSVTSSWEKLGDTGGIQASLGKTEGGTKTSTSSTNNNGIILMVLETIVRLKARSRVLER